MHNIRILCFGDSNTWGTIGKWVEDDTPTLRYANRWTQILQKTLGSGYTVIEEGLGGRTCITPHPTEPWKLGETYLTPCLHTHRPIDWVVVMLGTNDLQLNKTMTEAELPLGISRIVDLIQSSPKCGHDFVCPKILVLAPVEVMPSAPEGRTAVYAKFRCDIGRALSLKFPEVYRKVAEEKGCYFLSAQDFAKPGPADGVHLDEASHIRLGEAVADYIRSVEEANKA